MLTAASAGGLFLRPCGDVADDVVDLGHLRHDPLQRLAGLGHQLDALIDLRGRSRNQRLDLLGRLGRALRQRAHFRGDDREASAGVARARRLDPGVQREQIGLERDLVDHADDLADLLRRFRDGVHRLDRLAHHDGALLGVLVGGGDDLARVDRAFGRFLDGRGDLVERRRRLLEARRLLLGAPRQIVGGRRYLLRARSGWRSVLETTDSMVCFNLSIASLKSFLICAYFSEKPSPRRIRQIAGGEVLEAFAEATHRLGLLFGGFGAFGRRSLALGLGGGAVRGRFRLQPHAFNGVVLENMNGQSSGRARHPGHGGQGAVAVALGARHREGVGEGEGRGPLMPAKPPIASKNANATALEMKTLRQIIALMSSI